MASRSNTRSTLYTGKARNWIWAPIVIGIFLVIFCPGLLWYLKKRKLRQEGMSIDIHANMVKFMIFIIVSASNLCFVLL